MLKIAMYYSLHLLLFFVIIAIIMILYGDRPYTILGTYYLGAAGICSYFANTLVTFLGVLLFKKGEESIFPFWIPTILAILIGIPYFYRYDNPNPYFFLVILAASTVINLFTYHKINHPN